MTKFEIQRFQPLMGRWLMLHSVPTQEEARLRFAREYMEAEAAHRVVDLGSGAVMAYCAGASRRLTVGPGRTQAPE
jgi:hypothetical protein